MLSFIVAMDQNNVIGYQNEMPWHLPKDLRFFKEKTTGHTIVMGRKTFESIGKVLPNRKHIVLTSKKNGFPDEVEVIHDIKTIVERSEERRVGKEGRARGRQREGKNKGGATRRARPRIGDATGV